MIFGIFGLNNHLVRRSESLQPSVNHSGSSIMVSSCISTSVVGYLVKINGTTNIEIKSQNLIHHAIPSGKHLIATAAFFKHDTDLKHYIENHLFPTFPNVTWSVKSQLLLEHLDIRVKFWPEHHKSIDGSVVNASDGSVMVWRICSSFSLPKYSY